MNHRIHLSGLMPRTNGTTCSEDSVAADSADLKIGYLLDRRNLMSSIPIAVAVLIGITGISLVKAGIVSKAVSSRRPEFGCFRAWLIFLDL